jgi:integral membrane protein
VTSAAPTASRWPLATPRGLFRLVAIAEAVSWTLLIAGLVVRALTGAGAGVSVGGGFHGFVFLAYAGTAVLMTIHQRWSAGVAVVAIASAVVPYATIPTERWLRRTGRLDGAWRVEATADPRDARPLDRLVRTLLRHRVAFAIGAIALVAVVFVVLLVVGPPGR